MNSLPELVAVNARAAAAAAGKFGRSCRNRCRCPHRANPHHENENYTDQI